MNLQDAIKVATDNGFEVKFKGDQVFLTREKCYDFSYYPFSAETLFRLMFKLKKENKVSETP